MISLESILKIPQFSYIKPINSHADLSRIVGSVDISETPDMADFLAKNVLLLTTGMSFKDDPKALCALIEKLHKLPAAGIGIKLGRFIHTLDDSVIETADRLRFPLLQLPLTMTLGMMCHEILTLVWDIQTKKLLYALEIQRQFSKMLIEGATLSSFVQQLGKVLKHPVFLLNPFVDILTTSLPNGKTSPAMLRALRLIKENPVYRQVSDEDMSFAMEMPGAEPIVVSITPVKATIYSPYLLVILQSVSIPYPYSQLVTQQVANILAITLYENQKLVVNIWKSKENFFQKLTKPLDKSNGALLQLIEYGKNFNLVVSDSYRVILVTIDNFPLSRLSHQMDIHAITFEWLEKQLEKHFENALLFPLPNLDTIAILLQNNVEFLENILRKMATEIKEYLPTSLSFAVGNEVFELSSVYFSVMEANDILLQCKKAQMTSFIQFYASQGIVELLQFIPSEHSKHFCIHILKSLAYPVLEVQMELRQTLQVYLDCQGEITETAKILYIHRNTVKYRLAKITELLGYEIDNPNHILQLRIALLLSSDA